MLPGACLQSSEEVWVRLGSHSGQRAIRQCNIYSHHLHCAFQIEENRSANLLEEDTAVVSQQQSGLSDQCLCNV